MYKITYTVNKNALMAVGILQRHTSGTNVFTFHTDFELVRVTSSFELLGFDSFDALSQLVECS